MQFLHTFAFHPPSLPLPSSSDKHKPSSFLSSLRFSLFSLLDQTYLLTYKTFLVLSRHPISLYAQVLAPIFLCLFVYTVQVMVQHTLARYIDPNPQSEPISVIPRCRGTGCITLGVGYTAGETDWTEAIVRHIATNQHLSLGTDIQTIGETYNSTLEYFKTHPNETQTAVIFCTGTLHLASVTSVEQVLCSGSGSYDLMIYSIVMNFSAANLPILLKPDEKSPINRAVLPYKIAVDSAIIDFHRARKGLPAVTLSPVMSDFPHIKNRMAANFDTVTLQGPLYFFLPPMVVFMLVMTEMVREKEQHLRRCLTVLGTSHTAYWLSWVLVGGVCAFVVSNVTVTVGNSLGFDFFVNSPYL